MKKALTTIMVIALFLTSCGRDIGTVDINTDSASKDAVTSETESTANVDISSGTADSTIGIFTAVGDERLGFASVISRIQSSVVAINVTGTATYYYQTYPTEGSGSGVIVSEDGYVVTNNHVISGGQNITVYLFDGTTYPAKLVASDPDTDIAVLKIEATGLNAAVFGDSSTLRVGDFALAIGNPLGEYQGSVTLGIVSALNREIELDGEKHTMFQVDASVNPGNSGGGMFDSNGMLIGIVTAKSISDNVEGLGFVLPINDVKPVVQDLINYGYVKGRPTLGFDAVEISSMRLARYYGLKRIGVYVSSVESGSPAEQCGLQYKDYIGTADGEAISTLERLEEIVGAKQIGDTIVLEVVRNDTVFDVVLPVSEKID